MSKPNLVLLHGWGVNSRVWDDVFPPLSRSFNVHALDLPGYGSRSEIETGDSLSALADDVLSRAPSSAIWCGWSLGGMVAIAAALQQPERIERLSLVCTTPRFMQTDGWPHGSSETLMENLATQFERDYAKALSRFFLLQFGSAPDARTQSREIAKRVLAEPPAAWQSLEQGLNLLRTVDLRDQLGSLSIPTQVIVGKEDRVIPADAGRFLASNIPEAALVEANSGHIPFLIDPAWFVKQIREFSGLRSLS